MAPSLALAPACYSFAIRSPGVSPRITKPAYKRPLEVDGEFLITGFSAVTLQIPKQTSSNAIAFFHSRMLSSRKIGRAHVSNPVTNAHLVCRLLLEQNKKYLPYTLITRQE